jgi:hypothetical protein
MDLCGQRSHLAKVARCRLSCLFEIVIRLESHPELLGRTEPPVKRSAVSADIERLPNTISLMRRGGTPIARARAFWLMSIGFRNSSSKTSPG